MGYEVEGEQPTVGSREAKIDEAERRAFKAAIQANQTGLEIENPYPEDSGEGMAWRSEYGRVRKKEAGGE